MFAAVRAARLGAKVVLVERQNMLGGTATAGLVNVWHSLKYTDYKEYVIAGLTGEMTQRLVRADAAILKDDPSVAICFDPNRLAYELDKLVSEEKIKVLFHTFAFVSVNENKAVFDLDGTKIRKLLAKGGSAAVICNLQKQSGCLQKYKSRILFAE